MRFGINGYTQRRPISLLAGLHVFVKGISVMKVSSSQEGGLKPSMLVNVDRLVTQYYMKTPDPSVPGQRVAFRGASLKKRRRWSMLLWRQRRNGATNHE
jgi:hypothetical protein